MCKRIELLGLAFDPLQPDEAAGQIQAWIAAGRSRCRLVLLPGIEEIVLLRHHPRLNSVYSDADLVLTASAALLWAAKWLKKPLRYRVVAAGLITALFDAARSEQPLSVFILGAPRQAAVTMETRWPQVRVTGAYCPPPHFEQDRAESLRILARIADAKPDLVLIALPTASPAAWLHQHRAQVQARVALCMGASFESLMGSDTGQTSWALAAGLNLLHQVSGDPGRLAARCTHVVWSFPQMVFREWWQSARTHELVRTWQR